MFNGFTPNLTSIQLARSENGESNFLSPSFMAFDSIYSLSPDDTILLSVIFFKVTHNFLYIQLIRTISSKSRNSVQFNWILYCKTNEIILFYKSSNGLLIRCISLLSLNCCVPIALEYNVSLFRFPKGELQSYALKYVD